MGWAGTLQETLWNVRAIYPEIVVQFGRNLKAARISAGLTQRELAARAGVALSLIIRIESGLCDPDLRLVGSLAKCVGRTVSELLRF